VNQLADVTDEISYMSPDIIVFQEMTAAGNIQMDAHPSMVDYSHVINGATSLQIAIYFNDNFVEKVGSASVLSTFTKTQGRYPIVQKFRNKFTLNEFVVIGVHFDSTLDATGESNRADTVTDLISYVETNYSGQRVIIAGDMNTMLSQARWSGGTSELASFITAGYKTDNSDDSLSENQSYLPSNLRLDHMFFKNFNFTGNKSLHNKMLERDASFETTTSDHVPVYSSVVV
ncbi:hypothetical protein KDA00_05835, partial [Candidatus Saccharibacteria bacterium]|nr:hypothetical protein [Candidatus Saccharibacteria bacterium]